MYKTHNLRLRLPMQMKHSGFFYRLILCASLLFSHHATAQTVTIKLGHVGTETSAIGTGAKQFADHLETVSNGKLVVDIIPRAALGGVPDHWAQMQAGSLDMHVIDVAALSLLKDARDLQVLLIPFLFNDQQHLRRYLSSELFLNRIRQIGQTTSIRYLGVVAERAPRIVSTTEKPIISAQDLRGVKIRIPGNPMFSAIFQTWGANPTPTSASDMFMALKTGMVDGEDNGVINLTNSSNIEVIKHVTPINWHRAAVAGWISEKRWQTFTDEQREWIVAAIDLSTLDATSQYQQRLDDAMNLLAASGIRIHEPDIQSFQFVTNEIVEKYEGKIWSVGLAELIANFQQ